jgi:hypothetical protein
MNLYISCGLTHVPRQMFPDYVEFLHKLARTLRSLPAVHEVRYALVDSDPQLAYKPAAERAALCYDWDRRMVEAADLVVADASFPSTGLGIELQLAEAAGKPIIMLIGDHGFNRIASAHYENPDRSEHDLQVGDGIVSLMAMGLPCIRKIVRYSNFEGGITGAVEAIELYT